MATISNKQAAELALLVKGQISDYITANKAAYIEWLETQTSADCIAELDAIRAAGEKGIS